MGRAVIYEVSLDVDRTVAVEFDAWLAGHVRELLTLPGFLEASIYRAEAETELGDTTRLRRVVHYTLESGAALERYLREDAPRFRAETERMFTGRVLSSRRVLTEGRRSTREAAPVEAHCRNCATALTGQYCSRCGQRAGVRMITLWELIRDVFGDLFELDSRLWRSLLPLLARPGHLTREYLEGRRVRYMPPFRMYLVLSVIFFLLVSVFSAQSDLRVQIGDESASEEMPRTTESAGAESDGEEADAPPAAADEAGEPVETAGAKPEPRPEDACDSGEISTVTTGFRWLDSRLSEEHLREVCREVVADRGETAIKEFLRNIPTMMFLFLPLIALLMKFLYPLSKRYYVEHLLFFVHYHAFFFLAMTLLLLWLEAVEALALPGALATMTGIAVSLYIPVYLFIAMRKVYAQGRLATTVKYLLLGIGYFVSLLLTFTLGLIYTAITL
jgi:hypothetical protein